MPCYNPIRAWRKRRLDKDTGKRGITFTRSEGLEDMEVQIPCGKCMGCRVRKSIDWALRCVHESQSYERNCFVTLTYSDENCPQDMSLNKKHFQDFMKRLRESEPQKIRFFMCGEYGDQFGRPHYHAILFNYWPKDAKHFRYANKSILYTSESLEELWGHGFVTIGEANYTSAAYTARYSTKKIFGEKAEEHYQGREPEYCQMSLRPGLGYDYAVKYADELKLHDCIVYNGRSYPLPRYYELVFDELEKQKNKRKLKVNKRENHTDRLRVREEVAESTRKQYGQR